LIKAAKDYNNKSLDKFLETFPIDNLIEDLLKIRVETLDGRSHEIKGKYVEPIQLQVVCQRLWNKLMTSQVDHITQDPIAFLGDVDRALEDFYAETIREASEQTSISEDIIRNWVEEKLITSSETRGIVHREVKSTGGIPNTAVDILEKKYLIRKEERSGAQWYELTHDRFIKPILDSNKEWKDRLEKEKEKYFSELWQKALAVSKLHLESENQVLGAFYDAVIKESIHKTGIEEDKLRNWFEENLINSSGTRDIVQRGSESTGGMPNVVVDILEKKYLIRKEERSGAQWYELTHDRLIRPILDSNKDWEYHGFRSFRQRFKQRFRV